MRLILLLCSFLLAAHTCAQLPILEVRDIVYTQATGFPQKLDLYMPNVKNMSRRPGIVFVHGGGWAGGDKSAYVASCRYYAGRGYVCISINYRLTPAHRWPAQIDDTQAAVRWMRKNAGLLNLIPSRIGAIGASAGGHLVLFLGSVETLNDFDPSLSGYPSRVQAVVDYFGPTDLTKPQEWAPPIWSLIVALVGEPWWPGSPAYEAPSPFFYVDPSDAPTVIFHGTADATVPVDQSRRIVTRMQAHQVWVEYHEFVGQGHGFTAPVNATCTQITDAFLFSRIGR